jgi:hypothetical protein
MRVMLAGGTSDDCSQARACRPRVRKRDVRDDAQGQRGRFRSNPLEGKGARPRSETVTVGRIVADALLRTVNVRAVDVWLGGSGAGGRSGPPNSVWARARAMAPGWVPEKLSSRTKTKLLRQMLALALPPWTLRGPRRRHRIARPTPPACRRRCALDRLSIPVSSAFWPRRPGALTLGEDPKPDVEVGAQTIDAHKPLGHAVLVEVDPPNRWRLADRRDAPLVRRFLARQGFLAAGA